jgi:hypothetical protein
MRFQHHGDDDDMAWPAGPTYHREREGEGDTDSGVTLGGPWAVFLPGPKGYPSASFFFSNSFLFFFSDFFCRNCKKTPNWFKPIL